MTSFAVSMRVGRLPCCVVSGPAVSITARIEPERSSTTMMSMPRSPDCSSRRRFCGRASAAKAKTSAAPRSTPGRSRKYVRVPRGPTTSGAMVGMRSFGIRASAPSVIATSKMGGATAATMSHGHPVHFTVDHSPSRNHTGTIAATAATHHIAHTSPSPRSHAIHQRVTSSPPRLARRCSETRAARGPSSCAR